MERTQRLLFVLLLGIACAGPTFTPSPLCAQENKPGQAPRDQKADELIRSAQRWEMFGYVAAVLGILIIVASIPLSIYYERRKKARQQALSLDEPGKSNLPPRE
jgi:hypothetical protein